MHPIARFILLLALCAPSTAFAWQFTLSGKITEFDPRTLKEVCLDSAVILLYKDGALVQHIAKKDSCRFRFSLDPDAEYMLACGKPGYITKWFSINTKNAPAKIETAWDMELDLFRTFPGIDYSVFENPLAIIKYNPAPDLEDFDYDKEYSLGVAPRAKKAKDETDAARQNAMLHSCDLFYPALALADSAYAKGDWETAYKMYRSARALHPYEPGIDKLVAEAKTKMDSAGLALDAQYNSLIAQAGNAFSGKLYTRAKVLYADASALKPGEVYPQERIKTCYEMIAQDPDKEAKYRNLIAGADGNFMLGDWKEARLLYLEAMCYKPNDQYARNQVRSCNAKLPD